MTSACFKTFRRDGNSGRSILTWFIEFSFHVLAKS